MPSHLPVLWALVLAALAALASCNGPYGENSRRGAELLIPNRVPLIPIPKVEFNKPGDQLNIRLFPNFARLFWDATKEPTEALEWKAVAWQAEGYDLRLFMPAIILGTDAFRIKTINELPFQPPCECGCTVNGNSSYCDTCVSESRMTPSNPFGLTAGFTNPTFTNVHTHGLHVDVGQSRLVPGQTDVCQKLYSREAACSPDFDPSGIDCQIYGDNIFPRLLSGGMSGTNTYFPPRNVPGISWFHAHQQGDVSYQTPTGSGFIITPDINPHQLFVPKGTPKVKDMKGITTWAGWDEAIAKEGKQLDPWEQYKSWTYDGVNKVGVWPGGIGLDEATDNYWASFGNTQAAQDCKSFVNIIKDFPNFSPASEILHFEGLWFRKQVDGVTPDDDTIPFIACQSQPPDPLLCPNGVPTGPGGPIDPNNLINIKNIAGKDFTAVNSVIQPTVQLEAGRFKRWMMVSSYTEKWMDLTIRPYPKPGQRKLGAPVDSCKMYLLAHDGVYLEHVPRFPRSRNVVNPGPEGDVFVNDVVLGPGNRADILIKCDKPGQYVLASGAGPFTINPACAATHCELFGGFFNYTNTSSPITGNNYLDGHELNAAVMAVIDVIVPENCQSWHQSGRKGTPPPGCEQQADLQEEVCRTRLELFSYADSGRTPSTHVPANQPEQDQCWDLVNLAGGAGCMVNGVMWGNVTVGKGLACLNEGYRQVWEYRGIDFHPFHLHETPVRTNELPPCLNIQNTDAYPVSTNWWKVSDWWDTIFIPMCQKKTPHGEQMLNDFNTDLFPPVPQNFATRDLVQLQAIAAQFLGQYYQLNYHLGDFTGKGFKNAKCADRYSVLHCHHLAHEDEGCIAIVWWNCLTDPAMKNGRTGVCPANGMCPDGVATSSMVSNWMSRAQEIRAEHLHYMSGPDSESNSGSDSSTGKVSKESQARTDSVDQSGVDSISVVMMVVDPASGM